LLNVHFGLVSKEWGLDMGGGVWRRGAGFVVNALLYVNVWLFASRVLRCGSLLLCKYKKNTKICGAEIYILLKTITHSNTHFSRIASRMHTHAHTHTHPPTPTRRLNYPGVVSEVVCYIKHRWRPAEKAHLKFGADK